MKKWMALTLVGGALLFVVASQNVASGGEEERAITAQGVCSGQTKWGLTMEPDVGIRFEVHLETGVPDQDWQVVLGYNHHVILKTIVRTEEDGGFEVLEVENNAVGQDVARLHARNLDTGEVCWGTLTATL